MHDIDQNDWMLGPALPKGRRLNFIHDRAMIFAVKNWTQFLNQALQAGTNRRPRIGFLPLLFFELEQNGQSHRHRLSYQEPASRRMGGASIHRLSPVCRDTQSAEDGPFAKFGLCVNRGLETFGIDHTLSMRGRMHQLAQDTGFRDIDEITISSPLF